MVETEQFAGHLGKYRAGVDRLIAESIELLGPKTTLRDACEYALLNGGKRFRPALVLMIAKTLNAEVDVTLAALAVEYFHTASLIADDLPCMDDDVERRGVATLHKVYGEATALMASYALISAGYGNLALGAQLLENSGAKHACLAKEICALSLQNVAYNTGLHGATGGQYLDLCPTEITLETIKDVICKKTISLFEISFVLGWLYGGGNIDLLPQIKRAAYHFGMAFQIADDIDDIDQDAKNNHPINMAALIGKDAAISLCEEEIDACRRLLQSLSIDTPELLGLLMLLESSVSLNGKI